MVIENKKGEGKSSQIILITGGTKSGKSEFAEYLGSKYPNLTYVALSEERPKDKNWQQKISIHRERRPIEWKTIETTDLIKILRSEKSPLLIDSIGGFIMKHINLLLFHVYLYSFSNSYFEKYHQVARGIIVAAINKPITIYVAVELSVSLALITLKFGSTTGLSIDDG